MARRINLPTKQIPLNLTELEKLGTLQVTHIELAAWYSVSKRTIENRFDSARRYEFAGKLMTFREIFERGQAKGRMTLRRKQMQLAEAGHCTMLIWLGKQRLGQRDRFDTEHSGPAGKPIPVIVLPALQALTEEHIMAVPQVTK